MYKIMVIEDYEKTCQELCELLRKNGYEAVSIRHFDQVVHEIDLAKPDLILLDLNLPYVDGFYILREVRQKSNLPILVVTSSNQDIDELYSFNLGADDFIVKPYNVHVLLARINKTIQRVYEPTQANIINVRGIELNLSKSTLSYQNETIELTKNELRIIHCLFTHLNQVVSRNDLMQYMWNCDLFLDDNTLTVNINRLRKKLELLKLDQLIVTKRGMGYIIYETE